jgi:hypothetical protein
MKLKAKISTKAITKTPISTHAYTPIFKLKPMNKIPNVKAIGAENKLGNSLIKFTKASISKKFILAIRELSAMKLKA